MLWVVQPGQDFRRGRRMPSLFRDAAFVARATSADFLPTVDRPQARGPLQELSKGTCQAMITYTGSDFHSFPTDKVPHTAT